MRRCRGTDSRVLDPSEAARLLKRSALLEVRHEALGNGPNAGLQSARHDSRRWVRFQGGQRPIVASALIYRLLLLALGLKPLLVVLPELELLALGLQLLQSLLLHLLQPLLLLLDLEPLLFQPLPQDLLFLQSLLLHLHLLLALLLLQILVLPLLLLIILLLLPGIIALGMCRDG